MPMYKGWKPDPAKVARAGRIAAKNSPWRGTPLSPERRKQLDGERIARLRDMGVIAFSKKIESGIRVKGRNVSVKVVAP